MTGVTEFSLIKQYFTFDSEREDVILGVGDDCALLAPPANKQLAVTVDTLVAGVHFPLNTSPADIAYKSLAVSLSDLAAMAAEPAWATLALTMPDSDHDWLQEFSTSFKESLKDYGVQLIGGDTTQGPLSITVQLTGFIEAGKAMRRDTARVGDRIYVTGHLGDAALGLKLLNIHDLPDSTIKGACVKKLNRPVPRVVFAQQAADYCGCAIDISDGLVADLGHILKASGCGGRIYFSQLPVSKAFRKSQVYLNQFNYSQMLLAGGDDYELCLVASAHNEEALFALAESTGVLLTHIGEIDASTSLSVINTAGEAIAVNTSGYEHFSDE
ncbi:MAG: thiamine-phosphate kinase [Gammaproteobacteria bacterium]|nr:thiamine-phosphate kinase [Gammaproteobacteria bacterium]